MTAQNRPGAEANIVWRDLSYDVSWEASDNGIVRCRTVLNRRGDIFNAVEGASLRAIRSARRDKSAFDLLRESGRMRHIEVRLPKPFGPDRLYLTAALLAGGGMAGTFQAVAPPLDDVFDGELSLLSHVSEARQREEAHRREAEIMLRGLRLLLGDMTVADKLSLLSGLVGEAVDCSEHHMLQIAPDGAIRSPTFAPFPAGMQQTLLPAFQAQIPPVAVHRGETPVARTLRRLLGVQDGDIAAIVLPVGAQSTVLICRARGGHAFEARHVDAASRLALLLKQVLVLKEEQDKLVQAARLSALGQMSASLAHELRQPLNTISVTAHNLELLIQDGAEPGPVLTKVKRILAQVERAGGIMDRVRQFSRKNGGDLVSADLACLAHGVAALSEHMVQAAGVTLSIAVPDGLAARCDAIQIEQVLVNLVRNALDALGGIGNAQGKTGNGSITISGHRSQDGVVLRVQDNGPGFPPAALARPLETFFTTKPSGSGTGLGLSICNTIARDHAGNLAVGNHAGGAFVELHLPDRPL